MDITSIIVVLLGIISVATGFAAEFTRVEASEVTVDVYGRCSYPSSPALLLGIASAVTLLIDKIIINVATGCFCCKPRTAPSNRSKALCFYIVFWITFIIAIGLLLTGVKLNERHDDAVVKNGYYYCYVIKPGVFAGGAVLAGLSCIFGVVYYRTVNSKGKNADSAQNQGGIAMAHPQFPV
ncbi:hypothetical protein like AT5G17210 [Hibiscus trionum]|uniref:Uncharacterized protein n=1 Tax=Hibiscus trionum TaxID=183268 RepID=A0A9W7MB68_HIBTR|nr:hypothetical protein like AT5G17210 [Hibiscus trionum]